MDLDTIKAQVRARMPEMIAGLRAKAADHSAVAREAGYSIRNAAGDEAVIRIYDEIWFLGVNALDFANDLEGVTAPRIRVEINSPGGDVWDGIAIYNALRAHPAHVTTRVDGIAASIASVIAQAGDHRVMLGGSQMMIHNAWGFTVGDHGDHEDMASVLAHQDGIIAGIYSSRSGGDAEHFRTLMEAETWLTADAAVEAGLADEVIDPPAVPGDSLAEKITALAKSTVIDDVERLVADHGSTGLTGAKREGLVALHARLDGLLNPAEDTDPELIEKKAAFARRDTDFRLSIPAHLL